MRVLYSLILTLLTPLVLLRLWWRGRVAPGYRLRWGERFGQINPIEGQPIWVHAVSVGETVAAVPLIRKLMQNYPGVPLLVTTTTPTGSERLRALFGDQVEHVYMPYDLPWAVTGFLENARPRLALMMETEIWPNLFFHCHARQIPVVVANARLSERSAKGYAKVGRLTRETLSKVSLIAAQGEDDAQRFIELGAPSAKVEVTGSIKFDIKQSASVKEQAEVLRRDIWGVDRSVWVAASTHEGEDEQVLAAFAQVRRRVTDALLVLVPRHPERFERVAQFARNAGYQVVCRSEHQPCGAKTQVFIGDSMGELGMFFTAADVCFMGGSLVPVGGHNILEAAVAAKPVVFGPHMFNFDAISKMFLEREAATQVADCDELARVVISWLEDANLRDEVGTRAEQLLAENRGALDRLVTIVARQFDPED